MINTTKPEILIAELLLEKKLTVATAESCTGGLVSSRLTDVSGSSSYIKLNMVTYSNEAKTKMLSVKTDTLIIHGAVSEEVALEMASGIKNLAETDIGLGITGIAGPSGGTAQKPVGLVYIGIASNKKKIVHKVNIDQSLPRTEIKQQASQLALEFLIEFINGTYAI